MATQVAESPAAVPQTGTVLLVERAPESHATEAYLKGAAELLWPLLIITIVWWLRHELRRIAITIATRVENPNTKVVMGPFELSLASKVESLELDQQVVAAQWRAGRSDAAARPAVDSIPPELMALAEDYLGVQIADWRARVERKDEIAVMMARMVIDAQVSRKALAESPNEGIRMALATAIHVDPQENDDFWILQGGRQIRRRHVRYRFLMAMARLVDRKLVRPEFVPPLQAQCIDYMDGADASLVTRIQRTRAALDHYSP